MSWIFPGVVAAAMRHTDHRNGAWHRKTPELLHQSEAVPNVLDDVGQQELLDGIVGQINRRLTNVIQISDEINSRQRSCIQVNPALLYIPSASHVQLIWRLAPIRTAFHTSLTSLCSSCAPACRKRVWPQRRAELTFALSRATPRTVADKGRPSNALS